MPFSALTTANQFYELAKSQGKTLTNMQLQKLVFLAQGYCLALLGRKLFYHNVNAWQWGPVIPKLYKPLMKYGSGEVKDRLPDDGEKIPEDSEEYGVILAIWRAFGGYTGARLSGITHQEGSPWSITWNLDKFGIIPDELITEYYKKLLNVQAKPQDVS